jgi:hypothetical protein
LSRDDKHNVDERVDIGDKQVEKIIPHLDSKGRGRV